jgi:16S rRNA (uracil1498-N3)-methyltransferase
MKKIHRFLLQTPIPTVQEWKITEAPIVHQLVRVLKMVEGEEVVFFNDGQKEFVVKITHVSKNKLTVETKEIRDILVAKHRLTVALSVLKNNAFEYAVQKLTQLGVHTIVPIVSNRTVKKTLKVQRLQKISDEALEQSGGVERTIITDPISLDECLQKYHMKSIAFERGYDVPKEKIREDMVVYIGPEGGWSEDDLALLKSHGALFVGLGNRTLRADTAAIVGAYTLL